jgi:hypothetical protein
MDLPEDFIEFKQWPAVLDERTQIGSEPAVYALLHERSFGRLQGQSRVLYIGSTSQLGGSSQSCRLRIYRYPNGTHAKELRRRVQLLIDSGFEITFQWKHVASKEEASQQEVLMLQQYVTEHGELPPFNGRRENEL